MYTTVGATGVSAKQRQRQEVIYFVGAPIVALLFVAALVYTNAACVAILEYYFTSQGTYAVATLFAALACYGLIVVVIFSMAYLEHHGSWKLFYHRVKELFAYLIPKGTSPLVNQVGMTSPFTERVGEVPYTLTIAPPTPEGTRQRDLQHIYEQQAAVRQITGALFATEDVEKCM